MRKNLILSVVFSIWFSCAAFQKQSLNSTTPDSNASKTVVGKAASVATPQKLMVPPLAYDDSSITVIWSKPSDYSNVVSYNVYVHGSLAGNTKNLFYNLTGLEPNSPYSIIVKAVNASGEESPSSNKVMAQTAPAMKVFNVTDYGAVGDGKTLNTAAIQKAIDECTPGGKVLIPSGIFVSGALFLKSNMTLQIDGTLRGSDDANDYPLTSKRFPYYISGNNYMGLINAYTTNYGSITNVRIYGNGNVCGGSWAGGSAIDTVLGINERNASGGNDSARGDMIVIKGVNNFYIGGLTFTNPAMHTIFITYSENITANDINVSTFDIHNADGINICTSDTAYVFNSIFDTGDDCINLNAGVGADGVKENFPDNNIRIFNCTTKRGHGGVAFGSFTAAWIQNVLIEDCNFDGTDIGLRFKTNQSNGGGARNILCRDIIIKNIAKDAAIFFDSSYAHTPKYPSAGPGQFRDITIKNVTCTNLKKYGIYVNGLASMPHTNLSLSNVSIDGGTSGGAYINCCTNSSFDTINITNSSPPWTIDSNSASGLTFKNCSPAPNQQPKTVKNTGVVAEPAVIPAAASEAVPTVTSKLPDHKIRFVLVGDTTAKDRKGWGPGFRSFLTDRVECINTAIGGRSSKRFIDEGRWTEALALKGDYYLIQFGHNDESAKDASKTDPKTTYRECIKRYIDGTRAIGAKPILVTSLVRRQWDATDSNKINSSLAPYAEVVKELAKENNVLLVDLHARSKELCEQLGKEKCYEFSPIKDNNQIDNTHLNDKGSEMFGKIVVEELIKVAPELKPCFRNEPAPDTEKAAKP